MNTKQNHIKDRYQRQILLKEFGLKGQEKLAAARVLVVGAGGLGCPALLYLTAAGVGTIGIVDFDIVQASNLHRQVLFTESDIGAQKVTQAIHHLQQRNQEIKLVAHDLLLSPQNCFQILGQYDIVLDGTDNFSTRYLLNDACYLLRTPLVMGAISRFEGQVAVFWNKEESDVNYRDLFPTPPKPGEIKNCAEAGVLGVLPGIIGMQMANETIKLITGVGKPLINQLFTYHALTNHTDFFDVRVQTANRTLIPSDKKTFEQTNYRWLCGEENVEEILPEELEMWMKREALTIIDVREWGETPVPDNISYIQIPFSEFSDRLEEIPSGTILLFCQSGMRSKKAAQLLMEQRNNPVKVLSLAGGVLNWLTFTKANHGSKKTS